MASVSFEVIATFADDEQEIIDVDLPLPVSENELLSYILQQALEVEELENLVKLSVCQMNCASKKDLLPFMAETRGQYFFNPEINPTDNVKKLKNFCNRIIELRKAVTVQT